MNLHQLPLSKLTTAFKTEKQLKAFKILVVPGQRLDRLCAKIKFLKIRVLLHFAIKNSKLVCKMTRDSIPKNSASIANRVFKELQVRKWNAREGKNAFYADKFMVQINQSEGAREHCRELKHTSGKYIQPVHRG